MNIENEEVASHIEFVDGVLTEEDRKKIDELLKKIADENRECPERDFGHG